MSKSPKPQPAFTHEQVEEFLFALREIGFGTRNPETGKGALEMISMALAGGQGENITDSVTSSLQQVSSSIDRAADGLFAIADAIRGLNDE